MSLNSSREAIADSLVSLLQGIQDPRTNAPIYPLVKLGMIFNPENNCPWAAVWHWQGKGDYAGSGGNQIQWRTDDTVDFIITTGTGPYEADSTAAERAKLHIMDVVPPALRTHFQLPNASNPTNAIQSVYSVLLNNVDKTEVPKKFPDGHTYALWHLFVSVKQGYNVTLVQP
jgi:hypothetical protein